MELCMSSQKSSFFRHIWSLFVVAAVALLLAQILSFLSDQFESNIGKDFIDQFGVFGLYFSLALIDTFPTPGGAVSVLFLGVQGGMSAPLLFFLALLAFLVGRRRGGRIPDH